MYLAINKIKPFHFFLKSIHGVKKSALLVSILLFSNTIIHANSSLYESRNIELKYDPTQGAGGTYWVRRFENVQDNQAVICPSNRKQNCKFNFHKKLTYTEYQTKYLVFEFPDVTNGMNNQFDIQKYTNPGGEVTNDLRVNVNLKPGQRAVPIAYAYVKYVDGFTNNSKCSTYCRKRHGIYYSGFSTDPAYYKAIGYWKGNVYANWNRGVCILNEKTASPKVGDSVKNRCLGWDDPEIALGKWPSKLPDLPYLRHDPFSE